jgi:hypothetical protein
MRPPTGDVAAGIGDVSRTANRDAAGDARHVDGRIARAGRLRGAVWVKAGRGSSSGCLLFGKPKGPRVLLRLEQTAEQTPVEPFEALRVEGSLELPYERNPTPRTSAVVAPRLKDLIKRTVVFGDHPFETEDLAVSLSACLTEPARERAVRSELKERLGECCLIARRHKKSGLLGHHRLGDAANIACDDWLPQRHRLQKRHRDALGGARQTADICRAHNVHHVSPLPENLDYAIVARKVSQTVRFRTPSYDQTADAPIRPVGHSDRLEENVSRFLRP